MKQLLILGAALAGPSAAAAQTPPPPIVAAQAADPAALDAARDLLRAIDFEAQVERSAQVSARATFNTLLSAEESRRGEPMPSDLRATVEAAVADQVDGMVIRIKKTGLEEAANIYARYFTAAELRELQRLQTNPVMKKAQAISPALTSELMQIGVRAASAGLPEIEARLKQIVAEWLAKQQPGPRS